MKYRILSVSSVLIAVFAVASFMANSAEPVDKGSADAKLVSRNFKVGNFSKIDVEQGIKVVFRQTVNPGYAVVTADPKTLDRIDIRMDGDEVEISFKENSA